MSARELLRAMAEQVDRVFACCQPVGEVGRCMLRPDHTHACLPMPERILRCTLCRGHGRSAEGTGWPCPCCRGTGIVL